MGERTCGTCRWRFGRLRLDAAGVWRPKGSEPRTEVEYEEGGESASGECRRYPPPDRESHCFPGVFLSDWCGEWAAKEAP